MCPSLRARVGVKGVIEIDAITKLEGVASEAWAYSLGGRSALEWVMEEYRDFTPNLVILTAKKLCAVAT